MRQPQNNIICNSYLCDINVQCRRDDRFFLSLDATRNLALDGLGLAGIFAGGRGQADVAEDQNQAGELMALRHRQDRISGCK